MKPIERVARAIAKRWDSTPWERILWGDRERFLEDAREVLKAMRDATSEDFHRAWMVTDEYVTHEQYYRAMIDAALADAPEA